MLRLLIAACCAQATLGGFSARAGEGAWAENLVRNEAPLAAPPVTPPLPSEAMKAYRTIDAWVRAWEVPATVEEASLPSVGAAMVVLRLHGAVIGRGGDATEGPTAIVNATRAALAEAARRMPVGNDALREDAIRQLAADVTLSVELAGALLPLDSRTFEDAARRLSPGVDGVATRVGGRVATVFPSSMLTQSIAPLNALRSAASQAADDATFGLDEMNKLIDQHGAKFYRFRTTHLAQSGPGAAPAFLYRGGRVVRINEISVPELNAMADRIAEHLLTRDWPGEEPYGMLGTYDACRDVNDPRLAPPIEQLTACLSLTRFSATLDAGSARRAELRRYVDHVLDEMERVAPGEEDASVDAAASAAWIVVTSERAGLDAGETKGRREGEFTLRARRTVLGAYRMDTGYDAAVAAPAHSLLALALVRLAAEEKPGLLRDEGFMLAESAVRQVFRNASPGDLVARMPWLGWAELELAALKGETGVKSGVAFREMRKLVWEHQVVTTSDAANDQQGGGPDMEGGIVFSAAGVGTVLPTWQSARPLTFIGTMLGDTSLTSVEDRSLELARLIGSLRFLRQLQMDESTAWMCDSRRKSLGGIRGATWDQRLPSDASSMTLLALCEALRGIRVMTAP